MKLALISKNVACCQYKIKYFPNKSFECINDALPGKEYCLFHDKYFLQDKNHPDNEQIAIKGFKAKIYDHISNHKHIECIGYWLPDFEMGNILAQLGFDKPEFRISVDLSKCHFKKANFSGCKFLRGAQFNEAEFSDEANFADVELYGQISFNNSTFFATANFSSAKFSENNEADFVGTKFSDVYFFGTKFHGGANFQTARFSGEAIFVNTAFNNVTYFNYTIFENPNKIFFGAHTTADEDPIEDMSRVSFINTDITKVRFTDKVVWGGKDKFTIIEEDWVKNRITKLTFDGVLSVYRNLRENYEYRLRYDEAGTFFIKEMELKRKYRKIYSINSERGYDIKENSFLRRNLFSLIGWYRILSNYGESLLKPTVVGMLIIFFFTFLFVTQSHPYLAPSLSDIFTTKINTTKSNTSNILQSSGKNTNVTNEASIKPNTTTISKFIGLNQLGNFTHWQKSFERTTGDFIPLLSTPSDIKIGLIDFIIKIIGGAITFGLIAIALRRRFERKYTR
jgi:uncharacterized protein YjbI with pentapeptide repeats